MIFRLGLVSASLAALLSISSAADAAIYTQDFNDLGFAGPSLNLSAADQNSDRYSPAGIIGKSTTSLAGLSLAEPIWRQTASRQAVIIPMALFC